MKNTKKDFWKGVDLKNITQILKFLGILSFIIIFLFNSLLLVLLPVNNIRKRLWRIWLVHIYSKIGLEILGIDVHTSSISRDRNYFLVANHMSYIDVLVVAAKHPSCFVTSVEIKNTIGLGWLAKMGGCLFVERRNRNQLSMEVYEITRALKEGFSVMVFPEATSTNGDEVLRFKRPLFQSAIDAEISVLPTCFNYVSVSKNPVTEMNRDILCWYGNMNFLGHLWKLCEHNKIIVEWKILPDIKTVNINDPEVLREKSNWVIRRVFKSLTNRVSSEIVFTKMSKNAY